MLSRILARTNSNGNRKYEIAKDLDKGKYWLKIGADQNHADSQFFYGLSLIQPKYIINLKKNSSGLKILIFITT